jgi:hypothetical protein
MVPTFLVTTIIAFVMYFLGSLYSFYQYKQRKRLHERNSVFLQDFFANGVDVRKFPIFICAALVSRVLFFSIQYYYVSTRVDWYGLFMINCLEDIGYLLFITSFTILITFFGILYKLVDKADGGRHVLQRHHSTQSLRRTRRKRRYEEASINSKLDGNAMDIDNYHVNEYDDEGHLCQKCNFVCLAFTANAWLYVFQAIFLFGLMVTQDDKQGEVEYWRKVFFSLFYIIYIIQFARIGVALRKALHIMQIDSESLEQYVSTVVAVCCVSLCLQIISMLSRAAMGITKSSSISMNVTNVYFNMSIPADSGGVRTIETRTPSEYPKGSIISNHTVNNVVSVVAYENASRSFEIGPLVFFLSAEWFPVMYILWIMAPTKPVAIEDILKDMRRKEKKKIKLKKSNENGRIVNATQVEMTEISSSKGGSKTNDGENKDCATSDDDDGNEFWV